MSLLGKLKVNQISSGFGIRAHFLAGDVLQSSWKGPKDCYKNNQRQAEELSDTGSAYHKWCWAENVQFLESCSYKCSMLPRTSSVSLHDFSSDFELPPSIQLVSTTSIPTIPSLKAQIYFKESAEALRKDSLHTPLAVQSERESERSYKQRTSPTKKSFSNSADNGDRVHLKRARRADPSEAINFLFKSYTETFKSFPAKKQVILKVKLAKLFADAELEEMMEPSAAVSSLSDVDKHDYALGVDLETTQHSEDSVSI